MREYEVNFNNLLISLSLPKYYQKETPYRSEKRYFHELELSKYEIRFSITIWDVTEYFSLIGKYFDIDEIFIEDIYSAHSADILIAKVVTQQRDFPSRLHGVKELIYREEDNSAFVDLVYRSIDDTSWGIFVKKLSKDTFILLDLASSVHDMKEIKNIGFSILESIKVEENIK